MVNQRNDKKENEKKKKNEKEAFCNPQCFAKKKKNKTPKSTR